MVFNEKSRFLIVKMEFFRFSQIDRSIFPPSFEFRAPSGISSALVGLCYFFETRDLKLDWTFGLFFRGGLEPDLSPAVVARDFVVM